MNKIGLVIQREYLTRVQKKSFIVMTILMPILFVTLILGTAFLSLNSFGDIQTIAVVDETNQYFAAFHDTDRYRFVEVDDAFPSLFGGDSQDEVYATLIISGDLLANPADLTLYSRNQIQGSAQWAITSQLNEYLSELKLNSYDIPNLKTIIESSKIEVDMQSIRWDESGDKNQLSPGVTTGIGMVFTILIYMFIFVYGAMVMQGVMEEKSNRIIEVMISSVKPFDLMMGKLLGIGLVGLTQFGIWGILFALINVNLINVSGLVNSEMMMNLANLFADINLFELSIYFIIFFVGGYLIYGSLFAAIGALAENQEDSQQYMMPMTVIIMFAFYAGFYGSSNPDSTLLLWTSFIPFTSPFVMMSRICYGLPWWEIALSIGILAISIIIVVWFAAKIYRIGILMYGKKISYGEIIKWMRY